MAKETFRLGDIIYNRYLLGIAFMTLSMVVYTVHVTCQDIDGGATEADGGASAPVGPRVIYFESYIFLLLHDAINKAIKA